MDPNQQPATPPTEQPAPAAAPMPAAAAPVPGAHNPGQTLGIVSLVTGLLGISLVGLITGIIGLKKSKAAGMKNGLALAGIIISIISMILGILFFFLVILGTSKAIQECKANGTTVTNADGTTSYQCGSTSSTLE